MNNNLCILSDSHSKCWLLVISALLMLLLSSCGGGGGSSSNNENPDPFVPENTLDKKLLVYGVQVDGVTGNLVMYVGGTDEDGNALTVDDLQGATVSVSDADNTTSYTKANEELIIEQVVDGDKFLSLAFVTDYSRSITEADLDFIGSNVYQIILENLPLGYEVEAINFSDEPVGVLDWTEVATEDDRDKIVEDVKQVLADETMDHNYTALYEAIGFTLKRGNLPEGLIARCRPARMLVVFSDGVENIENPDNYTYTDVDTLIPLIEESGTVAIMLAASTGANTVVLERLAGDKGALVSVLQTDLISVEIDNWKQSLQHIAKFTLTLSPGADFRNNTVSIILGNQEVSVVLPDNPPCQP